MTATNIVASLYVLGFGLTGVGVLLLLIRTPRAISSIERDVERIKARLAEEWVIRRARGDADADISRDYGRLQSRLYEEARIPYTGGLTWGGPEHRPMMLTLERVWKANIPNTIVAVVGGLFSTIASVWSLYI